MPTSAQSRCLPLTYQRLPGSSPTSTVPRPGGDPRRRSAATRSVSSALIAAAVALPSRIVAVTTDSLPERRRDRRRGPRLGRSSGARPTAERRRRGAPTGLRRAQPTATDHRTSTADRAGRHVRGARTTPRRPACSILRRRSPPASACALDWLERARRHQPAGACVRNGLDDLAGAFSQRPLAAAGDRARRRRAVRARPAAVAAGPLAPLPRRRWRCSSAWRSPPPCWCRSPTRSGSSASSGAGFWFAIAVAVLGLLGSLKAVLDRPGRTSRAGESVRRRGRRARGRTAPPGPGRSARR